MVLRVDIDVFSYASATISFCTGPVTLASRGADNHIDFRPNPEVFEVDARLDREAGADEQTPVVVRLVVVHVDAVAVNRFAEAVARPVQDAIAVPGVPQHRRRRAVDLPAAQLLAARRRALDERDRGIARRRDSRKRAWRTARAPVVPYSPST